MRDAVLGPYMDAVLDPFLESWYDGCCFGSFFGVAI